MKIYKDFDFSKISYLGIGPKGKLLIVENENDLKEVFQNDKSRIIGNCSKIFFSKKRYKEIFYRLDGIYGRIEKISSNRIMVGGGVKFSKFLKFLIDEGITGFEELAGIPGTIGGMIKINAGAFGNNISKNLFSVITGEGETFKKDITFSYRYSTIEKPILFAIFNIEKDKREFIKNRIEYFVKKRRSSQPLNAKTLGSTFKNPSCDIFAWKLIDDAGFRGYCINDICVSKKHTNFIINQGWGSNRDFIKLIKLIKNKVYKLYKIELELEIEIV